MKQKGFTIIELLVVLAVGSAVMLAVVSSIFQIMQGRTHIVGKGVSLADIDSTAHWLNRDLSQAQLFTGLVEDAPPVSSISMTWNDLTGWAEDEGIVAHSASYTFSQPELVRTYDGTVTTIGRYLTDVGFSIDGKLITVSLTASQNGISGTEVTKTYVIQVRGELTTP